MHVTDRYASDWPSFPITQPCFNNKLYFGDTPGIRVLAKIIIAALSSTEVDNVENVRRKTNAKLIDRIPGVILKLVPESRLLSIYASAATRSIHIGPCKKQ